VAGVFAREGLANTRMDQIATAAGAPRATLLYLEVVFAGLEQR
jgi:AcrR family transcriptional regulator